METQIPHSYLLGILVHLALVLIVDHGVRAHELYILEELFIGVVLPAKHFLLIIFSYLLAPLANSGRLTSISLIEIGCLIAL